MSAASAQSRGARLVYLAACFGLAVVLGGGLYEHVCVWPRAFAAPPSSLTMFQGSYGLSPPVLWRRIHPMVVVLLALAAAMQWRTPRRRPLLVTLGAYVVVLAATVGYFAPEAMSIIGAPHADAVDPALLARASRWERLSLLRLGVLLLPTVWLYLAQPAPRELSD